ncbi:MAG: hypothetical protein Kow0010_07770 [Dehalococcoidia bacterium]
MANYENVLVDVDGDEGVATITLNRPEIHSRAPEAQVRALVAAGVPPKTRTSSS